MALTNGIVAIALTPLVLDLTVGPRPSVPTCSGVKFYPDPARKSAVSAARPINNDPLPEGNKRVGYLCTLEFVARNGRTWVYPPDDPETMTLSP